MSDRIDIDIEDLTIDEVDEVEQLVGKPIDEIFDGGRAKALRAIAFVITRRNDPDFTIEDAGKLKFRLVGADPQPAAAS